jgi:hypothetical protein
MIIDEGQPKNSEEDLSSPQDVRFQRIVFWFVLFSSSQSVVCTRCGRSSGSGNRPSDMSIYCSQKRDCRP